MAAEVPDAPGNMPVTNTAEESGLTAMARLPLMRSEASTVPLASRVHRAAPVAAS
jgi:hypothetical protein